MQGGYCLDAIANSALAVTQVILGEVPPQMPPLTASESATETIYAVAMEQSKYWKNLDPKKCEPIEGVSWAILRYLWDVCSKSSCARGM